MRWSQQELVDRVVQLAYRTNAERGTNLTVALLQKWENGAVKRPHYAYQRLLAELGAPPVPGQKRLESSLSLRGGADDQAIASSQLAILQEAADGDDEVSVPVRTDNGEVVFVTIPRRLLLKFAGLSTIGAALPPITSNVSDDVPPLDMNPVMHFRHMRRMLADSDNLFGPRRVIPAAKEQITIMRGVVEQLQGADRRELLGVQAQYAEFIGWLYQDAGEFQTARHWTDRALEWANLAADADLVAMIFMRKAQLGGDMVDRNSTADLAEVAVRMTPPGSHISAIATTHSAYGYALMGDGLATERAYERAHETLRSLDADPSWGRWFDAAYIEAQRARSLAELGDLKRAATGFENAISSVRNGYPRDRGVYSARAALVHAKSGEPERAAELGSYALSVGTATRSGRIMSQLARLADTLAGTKVPTVIDFCHTFEEAVATVERRDRRS
jgi:hypothetical protein